jgi:hypothetical protein
VVFQYARPAGAKHRKTAKDRQLVEGKEGGAGDGRGAESYYRKKSGPLQIIQYYLATTIERQYKHRDFRPEWVAWGADWIRERPQVRIYPASSCKSPPEHCQVTNLTVVTKSATAIDLVRVFAKK